MSSDEQKTCVSVEILEDEIESRIAEPILRKRGPEVLNLTDSLRKHAKSILRSTTSYCAKAQQRSILKHKRNDDTKNIDEPPKKSGKVVLKKSGKVVLFNHLQRQIEEHTETLAHLLSRQKQLISTNTPDSIFFSFCTEKGQQSLVIPVNVQPHETILRLLKVLYEDGTTLKPEYIMVTEANHKERLKLKPTNLMLNDTMNYTMNHIVHGSFEYDTSDSEEDDY